MTKFNNNQLLSPILEDILKGLDIKNLDGILKIFADIKFEALNGADNELFKAINKIKEIPELAEQININNLEKQLVRLQLNVLLSHCKETNSDLLKPLIEALDNKVGALNDIIEKKSDIKKLPEQKKIELPIKKPVSPSKPIKPRFNLQEALNKITEEVKRHSEEKIPKTIDEFQPISKTTSDTELSIYERILKNTPKRNRFSTLSQIQKNTKKSAADYLHIAYEDLRKLRLVIFDPDKIAARLNFNTNMENYNRQKQIEDEKRYTGQKGGNDPYYYKYQKYKSKYLNICIN